MPPPSPPTPRATPLNDSERLWLADQLTHARTLTGTAATPASPLPTLAALDDAWSTFLTRWEAAAPAAREDPNPLINAIGAALGQHLVDALGFHWVIATDASGADLAVHDAALAAFIYPANMVGKRFAARTPRFLASLFDQLSADLARARQAGA